MDSFMSLGFVTGMRHALDADHVAAVVSLGAQRTGVRSSLRFGICWGIGHALALLSIGAVVLSGNIRLPAIWTSVFESAVGAMLFVLGVDLLRRQLRDQLRRVPCRLSQLQWVIALQRVSLRRVQRRRRKRADACMAPHC